MTLLSGIQSRVEAKIFNRLGSSVVHSAYASGTTDDWGDTTSTYSTNETITTVPYNYVQSMVDYSKFGNLADGESLMAFKYNQDLNEKDTITFDTKTFIIKSIEKFPLSDGNILKVALLAESIV